MVAAGCSSGKMAKFSRNVLGLKFMQRHIEKQKQAEALEQADTKRDEVR